MERGKFSEDYFEGEYREGFYVESMMKRAWAAQIRVLEEFDTVCKRHNITWFADWGTLLGAIRHKGFIPWDDDVDIAMKREDLKKFLVVAEKELPAEYQVLNINMNEEWDQVHTRVVNRDRISFEEKDLEEFYGCPYSVGIDIFVLDYIPRDEEEAEVQRELINALLALDILCETGEMEMKSQIEQIEMLSGYKFDINGNLRNQALKLVDKLCQLYDYQESDYITEMPSFGKRKTYKLLKEWYDEVVYVPFENIMIPAPQNYDEVLKTMYGDYHKLVNNTDGHDYPFYKKQQAFYDELVQKLTK